MGNFVSCPADLRYVISGMAKSCLTYTLIMTAMKRKLLWINRGTCLECASFALAVAFLRLLRTSALRNAKDDDERRKNLRVVNAGSAAVASSLLLCMHPRFATPLVTSFVLSKTISSALTHHLSENYMSVVTVLMSCLASDQIVTMWLLQPKTLDPTYLRFLTRQSGLSKHCLSTMADYRARPVSNIRPLITDKFISSHHVVLFLLEFLAKQIPKSMKMYMVFYLIGAMFTLRKPWAEQLFRYSENVLRSTVFLSLYCTSGIAALLAANRLVPTKNVGLVKFYAINWISGLAVLCDRPSRRLSLATYISSYAIHSAMKHRFARNKIYFILFSAMLFYYYDQQPRILSSWLLDMHSTGCK